MKCQSLSFESDVSWGETHDPVCDCLDSFRAGGMSGSILRRQPPQSAVANGAVGKLPSQAGVRLPNSCAGRTVPRLGAQRKYRLCDAGAESLVLRTNGRPYLTPSLSLPLLRAGEGEIFRGRVPRAALVGRACPGLISCAPTGRSVRGAKRPFKARSVATSSSSICPRSG